MAMPKSFREVFQGRQFKEVEKKDVTSESRKGIDSIIESIECMSKTMEKIPSDFFSKLLNLPEVDINFEELQAQVSDWQSLVDKIIFIQLGYSREKESLLTEAEFYKLATFEKELSQYRRIINLLVMIQSIGIGKKQFQHRWPKDLRRIIKAKTDIQFTLCQHAGMIDGGHRCSECGSIVCPKCGETDFIRTEDTGHEFCRRCGGLF